MAVVSPFVVYNGTSGLDVRKATLWSELSPTEVQAYVRGTPEVPNTAQNVAFTTAKQADCDASPFVK